MIKKVDMLPDIDFSNTRSKSICDMINLHVNMQIFYQPIGNLLKIANSWISFESMMSCKFEKSYCEHGNFQI